MQDQIKHHLEQLVANPGDDRTLDTLVRLFEEKNALPAFARFLSDRAQQAPNAQLRAGLLVRAGEVTGLRLGDADGARGLFEQALSMNGDGNMEAEARVGLLSLQGEWGAVLGVYHQQLGAAQTPGEKSRVLCRMGRIYRDQLKDNTNAMKAYQTAFKVDRDCLHALVAAREIYAEVGNWKLVRQLLQLELQQRQHINDAAGVVNVLVILGDVLRLHLDNAETAAACYSGALERDPWNEGARGGLAELGYEPPPLPAEPDPSLSQEGPLSVEEALGQEPSEEEPSVEEPSMEDEVEDEVEVTAYLQTGEVMQEAQATEAVEVNVRPTMEVEEQDLEILEEARDEAMGASAEADVDVDIDMEEDEGEGIALQADPTHTVDIAAPPAVPSMEAQEAASVEEADEDEEADEEAIEVAQESLDEDMAESVQEDAAQESLAEEVASVDEADEADDVDDVDEADEADELESEEAVAEEAQEDVEEDVEEPVSVVEEAAASDDEEIAPGQEATSNEEAAEAEVDELEEAEAEVEEAPSSAAQEDEAEDVAEEAAPVVAGGEDEPGWQERAAALVAAGDMASLKKALGIHASRGGDVVAVLEQAMDVNDAEEGLYEAIRGRFADKGRWGQVLGALEEGAEASGSPVLRRQAARVKLYELGDVEGALEIAKGLEEEGAAGTLSREVADVKAAAGGSWRRLQQELETRHADLDAEGQAVAVYGRIAEVARALGEDARRLDALRHLVQGAPSAVDARRELKEIYQEREDWRNYSEILKQEVSATDGEDQIEALWELVEVYREKLRQDAMVVNTLNQLLDVSPRPRKVLDELAVQYEKMRRYPDLVSVLQKRADAAETLEDQVAVHLRVAQLFLDRFSNQGEALKAFEKVLELAPGHKEAIENLKQMYEKRREWEKLIELHEDEIAGLDSAQEKGERYKEIADLASQRMRRSSKGPELWGKVLDFLPNDLEALDALEKLYEREKSWEDFARIAERKLEALGEDPEAQKLAEKLGRIYTDRLEDNPAAMRIWRRVLELEPGNRRAQDSLKKLLIDAQDWDGLEAFFAATEDWQTYVRTLETLAGTIKEDDTKVDLLFRAAAVWSDHIDQTDRAVRSLERILSIDPSSAGAARRLAPIYEEAGDAKKLVQVLEILLGQLDPAQDPQETREVLLKLAHLYEDKLRNPEGSFDYYARAFTLYDFPAAPAPALSEDADVDVDVDEDEDEDADSVDAGDGGQAQAEVAAPVVRWEEAFSDLERVAEGLGAWNEVVEVYEAKLGQLQSQGREEASRELELRLGRIFHKELGDAHTALRYYDAVLGSDPAELRALAAQEEIFGQLGQMGDLLEVYDKRLALTADSQERIQILHSKAVLLEEHSEDLEGAVGCYREVVELAPEHRGALQALHRLYEALGQYEDLAHILRREVALLEANSPLGFKGVDGLSMEVEALEEAQVLKPGASLEEWLVLKVQLGLVDAQALLTPEAQAEAVEALRDVLAVDPDQEQALELLEALGQEPAFDHEVANTLEPYYVQKAMWEKLVLAREVQLTHLDEPEARVAKLLSIGQVLAENLTDFVRAFEAYGRALQEEPQGAEAMERLEAIADATDMWAPLVALWEDIGLGIEAVELRLSYQVRTAMAIERHLEDAPRAQQAWRAVLELDPDHEEALRHLEELYLEGQQWHELDEVYHRMLELMQRRALDTEDEEAAVAIASEVEALRMRQAMLHEEMLEDPAGAIDIYRAVLEEDSGNLRARQSLDRLLGSEGRFEEQAENLLRQLGLVEEQAEGLALKCRLAALKEAQLYEVEEAIVLWGQVLAVEPGYEDALEPLERLVRQAPEHQGAVVDILDPLYRQGEHWQKLVDLGELRLPTVEEPAARVGLLHEIAQLQETQLGDAEAAFGTMTRALREDVREPGTTQALYRLAAETGLWEELSAAFQRELAEVMDYDLLASLHMRVAAIEEQNLGRVDTATAHYQSIMESQPEHRGAMDNLERIYTATQQWTELVEILLHKANLLEEDDARRELMHRAATIQEEMLEDEARATEIYERVLGIDEGDALAIDNLERLYLGAQRWNELIDLYQRKLGLAQSDEERRTLHFQRGAVFEIELMDAFQAIDAYRAALDLNGEDGEALESLARLYISTEQWHELLSTLERQIELATEQAQALDLRQQVGVLYEHHLQDPMQAVEVYQGILENDPEYGPAAEALEGMIERGEAQVAAAEVLQPIYRRGERWEALSSLYSILVEASLDPINKLGYLKEQAQIQEYRLASPQGAFVAYGEALALAPEDEGVLETLERLASELDSWESLVSLLEAQVGELADMDVVRRLAMRMGRILEEELFDPNRAIEKYRMALDIDMADRASMVALDRLYEKSGRWEELAHILQEEIMLEEEEDARIELRMRLGALFETVLSDVDQAIATYREVLLSQPGHEGAMESLERMFGQGHAPMIIGEILEPIYEEGESWEKLVEVYMVQLNHREDPDERFAQLHRIANIYKEKLGDIDRTFVVMGNALAERPSDETTREELERIAEQTGAWEEVAGFYAGALDSAQDDPEVQRQLLLRVASIMDEHLAAVETAEDAYLRVLEMEPQDEQALAALDRIYTAGQRWPELAEVLRREIELSYDEDKVISLSYRLGVLCEQQLGDLDSAVDTYQSILNLRPLHPEALLALEQIYLAREDWEPLFQIYERQAELKVENQEDPAEVFAKMASLADQMLYRPLDAIDLWNRVLDLREKDATAMQALAALYEREGRYGDLVSILERQVEITSDPEARVDLLSRMGRVWFEELMNEDQALDAWSRVLALDPMNAPALFACRDLYQRTGQYEELVEVIERIITLEGIGHEDMLDLYVQLGSIQGDMLGRAEEAIEAWRAVLTLEPSHAMALGSLEQLYVDLGRWEECIDILNRKVEVLQASGDESDENLDNQIELLLRVADLWESRVGQPMQAMSAYEAVNEIDPGHMQASRALEALYTEQEDWGKLVELYLSRRDYIEDPFEGLELLRAAAQIFEQRLGKQDSAFLVLCRAFMENHEDEQIVADLERLARQTENWESLVTLYNDVLEKAGEGPEAVGLHIKIARWLADELGQNDQAIAHYRLAMEIEPDNTEVMAALERIFEKEGRWSELVSILELRADLTPEDDIRIDLYRKIGDIWNDQLQDLPQAVEAYRTILRIDQTDLGAMEALERIYEYSEAWTELIEILQRKASVIFEPEQVVQIKYRVANLWEQQVGSVERAVEAYQDVLSVEESHRPSREALERLFLHLERWHDLLDVYDRGLSLAQDGREQVELYHKMARVYEEELQDKGRAVEAYGRVMLLDQHDLPAIEQLERLYQEMEQWDELVQILERHVEASGEAMVKVELLRWMSQIQRDQLQDPYRAIESLRRLLELHGQYVEALYDLGGLYEHTSDWENALAIYSQLVELIADNEALVELYYRMGRIYEDNILDLDNAERCYQEAQKHRADHKPSLDALRSLYERREDWQGVVVMLRQEEEFTLDLEAKAELLCRIGRIYEYHLQDELRALDYYEQTIELSPENVEAAEPLSRMYLREKRWARAQPLLELLVRHRGHDRNDEDLFLLYYNLGQACEELAQPERAIKEYGEAYELNPNHLPTLLGMGRLLYRRGDYDRALRVYQTITQYHQAELDGAQLLELYQRSGQIQLALGNLQGAQSMFEAALQIDPDHADVIQALVELHGEQGNWEAVIAYRRRQLPQAGQDIERFTILREIGDIYAGELGNPNGAIQSYGEALQLQPDSVVVLRKMLDIYTGAQMWGEATQVLLRITDLEDDPGRKSKYLYTIAVIQRDEVGDMNAAVEYFNRALDADLGMLKAFEAIDRILTSQKDWKGLERAYRKMLRRISENESAANDALKFTLWKNLGEIYRTRQQNFTAAIDVYRVAVGMRPDNDDLHVILADLYERTGSHPEEAIKEHKHLIKMNPFRIASYRALFNSYMKTGRYDEAWCMASALTFLQKAEPKEQEFYQQYLTAEAQAPRRQLSPDYWKALYHPTQDLLTSNIMAILAVHMRQDYYAFDHKKTWGLHRRKDLLDLKQPTPFSQIYQWAAQCIAPNPVPYIYYKKDQIVPLRNGNLYPPALIVGPRLFQSIPDRERAFHVGKQLTLARPEHYLGAGFFPTENLKLLFLAALQFTRPQTNFGLNNQQAFVDALKRLAKMPPPVQLQLRQYCEQFFKTEQNPNLSAWLKALDHTSNRVALLICGDLTTACNCIRNEDASISKLTPKEKIKELVLFSISDSYFELRKQLGLALGQ